MKRSTHPDRRRWNEKYRREGFEAFAKEPSPWLKQHESLLMEQAKGLALDVAAGNGRNAFYLASLGFEVKALDISDVAIQWIRDQAQQRRVNVQANWTNLETEALGNEEYEVLVNFNYLQRSTFTGLKAALRPGGLLIFETMTTDQDDVLGSSINRRYLLASGELHRAFCDLEILAYREAVARYRPASEAKAVAGLVARKPGLLTSSD